ncbi:hypothetical protein BJ508DRAFT_315767 [Ascobolus immersus RN42]|uniref:Uncharacterized protein n=1 Tax=Ascobolus immersus RN42 TaxID=1160509 RepID=A0A3N4H9D5_ASCIM|nr:hypothetical protein BJ508DRAFT_315767 [Ascobolus immersus RN42]
MAPLKESPDDGPRHWTPLENLMSVYVGSGSISQLRSKIDNPHLREALGFVIPDWPEEWCHRDMGEIRNSAPPLLVQTLEEHMMFYFGLCYNPPPVWTVIRLPGLHFRSCYKLVLLIVSELVWSASLVLLVLHPQVVNGAEFPVLPVAFFEIAGFLYDDDPAHFFGEEPAGGHFFQRQ